jgi:hypothetical protein
MNEQNQLDILTLAVKQLNQKALNSGCICSICNKPITNHLCYEHDDPELKKTWNFNINKTSDGQTYYTIELYNPIFKEIRLNDKTINEYEQFKIENNKLYKNGSLVTSIEFHIISLRVPET